MRKPAKKTISAKPRKRSALSGRMTTMRDLRDELAQSVLTGLYANLADAQKFAGAFYKGMSLPEAFTRIAYEQADEAIRLRSL